MLVLIPIVFLCLLAAGFFAASETAITSVNRASIHQQALKGDPRAIFAQKFLDRVDLILGTTLVGTNLMHVAATSLGSIIIYASCVEAGIGEWKTVINTLIMTPLILIVGELVPKSLARAHCNRFVPRISRPLWFVQMALFPAVFGAAWFARTLGRMFGLTQGRKHGAVTREDVHAITEVAREEGVVPESAVLMMQTVLGLGRKPVSAVMRPLVDIVALPVGGTVGDLEDLIRQHGFARYPVFDDRIDNICGVVDSRQVIYGAPIDPERGGKLLRTAPLSAYVRRDLAFVPESKPVGDLLHELHFQRSPMAAVVDEHGGVTGIVTTEDLIEEVVGEILDERDEEAPELRSVARGTWECDGRYEISQLSGDLEYPFPKGNYSTLAGLVLELAGEIPRPGDTFETGPFKLEVLALEKRRIARIRISFKTRRKTL